MLLIDQAHIAADHVDRDADSIEHVLGGDMVRSHRLWESYLAKHFDLPLDHLHDPAERMEHFVTPAMPDQIAREVHDTSTDPHGRKIPE